MRFVRRVIAVRAGSDRYYEKLTGAKLDPDQIMGWHLRTVLGDALWRAEAGIPLPDKRTPVQWLDDLTVRFAALGTFD